MKDKANVKQHYLPQCYLKGFSENRKFINVYSKIHDRKSNIQSINNTGFKKNFYKIDEKFIKDKHKLDPNYFETEFFANAVEPEFKIILDKLSNINSGNLYDYLTSNDKNTLSYIIAIQYLRLSEIRYNYWHQNIKIENQRLDIIKSYVKNINNFNNGKNEIDDIKLEFDENYISAFHSKIYSNEEFLSEYANAFLSKIWILYINSESDFYTSDNPIIFKPHLDNGISLNTDGLEIIFPLSGKLLLTMWDRKYFCSKENLENTIIQIDPKKKREYNIYQYMFANEEIYSKSSDFKIINLLKSINGNNEIFKKQFILKVNGK